MNIYLDNTGNKFRLPKNEPVHWRISGYALAERKGKILVVVPTWNTLYELPGGRVEKDESIKDGITRECWEESGYKINISDNVPFYLAEQNFYNRILQRFCHSIIMVYRVAKISRKQDKSAINAINPNEISRVLWKKPSELTSENTHWSVYPAIEKFKRLNQK